MKTEVVQQQCPFCPEFLPGQPELWDKVEEGMQIDGILACGGCRAFVGYNQDPEYIGLAVARIRAREQEVEG